MPTTPTNIFAYIKDDSGFQSRKLTAEGLQSLFGGPGNVLVKEFPVGLGGQGSANGRDMSGSTDIPFVIFAPYMHNAIRSITPESILDELPPPKFAIALPIPTSALKTTHDVGYEQFNLDTIGSGIASNFKNPSGSNIAGGLLVGGVIGTATALLSRNAVTTGLLAGAAALGTAAGIGATTVSGLTAALTGASITGVPVENIVNRAYGIQQNPFTEVLFKNVEFRTHQFDYTFHPRSLQDSQRIDEIVRMFKFYMLPANGMPGIGNSFMATEIGKYMFSFPYEFQITYSVQDTTFTLMPSVLESVSVSYGGSHDSPQFFTSQTNGAQWPTQVTLQMRFKEVIILTRDKMDANSTAIQHDLTDVRGLPAETSTRNRYRF